MKTRGRWVVGAVAALTIAACGGNGASTTTSGAVAPSTTRGTTTSVPQQTTAAPDTTTTQDAGRTFTGVDGVDVDVSDASRIVTLTGDLTEIVYALGHGDEVVAVDVTTTYPEEAAAKIGRGDTVGFGQQLTPEAVLRFDPSLVIGDQTIAPQEVIDQLRGAGVAVVIIETQTTLDGVATKIEQVGDILDASEEAAVLAASVEADIAEAMDLIPPGAEAPSVAYIYARGPETIFLFGAGMPTQAMIEGAGATDAGAASGVFGPAPLTPEALVAAAPGVIVLPEAGLRALGGLEALLAIPGVSDTPAATSESFLVYDEAFFFNLGPRAGQALEQFVTDLYGLSG